MNPSLLLSTLLGVSILTCGCVSTVPFNVGHDKLPPANPARQGSLAVKPFVDSRGLTNAMQIGGKWDGAKPVYVAAQKRPVADIVTDYFQEALQKVGYQIQSTPGPDTPVLEANLTEFWLTDNWGGAFCKIAVQARLRGGANGQVVWEKLIRGEEDDWAIIPNAMQAAMNVLLKNAMTEFSSPAFSTAVTSQPQQAAKP